MKPNLLEFLLIIYILIFVKNSTSSISSQYKELPLESPNICSEVTTRKIRLNKHDKTALIVKQTRLSDHTLSWNQNYYCKFQVNSAYDDRSGGGIIAVIQFLNFRRNLVTDECIDYVQFRSKDKQLSQKYCGLINASIAMNLPDIDPFKKLNYDTGYIDKNGEMDVYINVSLRPLEFGQKTELQIVFTSYKHCSSVKHDDKLLPCDTFKVFCIHEDFFNDNIINCPYNGCTDENGCLKNDKSRQSIGNKVLIGSISALFIMFALFILGIWACKRHEIFCWSKEFLVFQFAQQDGPSAIPQTGNIPTVRPEPMSSLPMTELPSSSSRLAQETQASSSDPPPSYDSLFPNSK